VANRPKPLTIVVLIVVLATVGVGIALSARSGESDDPIFGGGAGSAPWPQDSLRDWASYADQLSIFTVADEEQLPAHRGEGGTGGYIGRAVTLQIERTLWRRARSPEANERVRIITWGWAERDGQLVPGKVDDGVRLRVGKRYLAPLTLREDGEWTLFADNAVLTLDKGVATGAVDAGTPSAPVRAFKGQTASEVARTLDSTAPDPLARKYADLPADARWEAVSTERP
jgi:hypothetical protein